MIVCHIFCIFAPVIGCHCGKTTTNCGAKIRQFSLLSNFRTAVLLKNIIFYCIFNLF